jgi:hypothetical protein
VWWYTSVTPVLRRLKQEIPEFEASLRYVSRNKKKKKKKRRVHPPQASKKLPEPC